MVRGLERFREFFGGYQDRYVLIGGTACSVAMEEVGLDFRATHDLDIVLCVEALDRQFVRAFWDFVRAGRYEIQEKSTGEKLFYRFSHPGDTSFPKMLELFSRAPDVLSPAEGSQLTPIPVGEEVSSLSAILLDEAYYAFIMEGRREVDGLSIVGADHLIPLKARAWLDIRERRQAGEGVDSKNIRKHRNDVFRLFTILDPTMRVDLPGGIRADMERFFQGSADGEGIKLKDLGIHGVSVEDVFRLLRKVFGMES